MLAIRFRNRAHALVALVLVAAMAVAIGWWLSPSRGVERSTDCEVTITEDDPRADALIDAALSGNGCAVIVTP